MPRTNLDGKMSPEELFEKAEEFETDGDAGRALRVWKTLADVRPDPIVLCRLAYVAEELGEIAEAKCALRRAIALDPDCSSAYVGLASISITEADYASAEHLLREALLFEQDEGTYSMLGVVLRGLGREEEARESYLKALEINPRFDEAYYNLGVLMSEVDRGEAEALFTKALECAPDYSQAHRELGWLLTRRNVLADGDRHLRKAIELQPDDAWAHLYLGNLFWRGGNIGDAIEQYRWAAEAAPDKAFPLWALANVYEERADWENAQGLYRRALSIEPDDSVGNMNFGRMLKKKGDLVAAREYLERALMLDPDYGAARALLVDLKEAQCVLRSPDL